MNLDKMARSGAHTKKGLQFLEAYAICGSVSEACDLSGTSPSTHYWRLKNFSGYRKKFADAHRAAIDHAVAEVRRRLRRGSARLSWRKIDTFRHLKKG